MIFVGVELDNFGEIMMTKGNYVLVAYVELGKEKGEESLMCSWCVKNGGSADE